MEFSEEFDEEDDEESIFADEGEIAMMDEVEDLDDDLD